MPSKGGMPQLSKLDRDIWSNFPDDILPQITQDNTAAILLFKSKLPALKSDPIKSFRQYFGRQNIETFDYIKITGFFFQIFQNIDKFKSSVDMIAFKKMFDEYIRLVLTNENGDTVNNWIAKNKNETIFKKGLLYCDQKLIIELSS